MVKFVVTGDWHIRIKADIPEEWQVARYLALFKAIIELCLKNKAKLILSGDILDRNRPSLTELKLLLRFFTEVGLAGVDTYLVSGNHEAIGRGECTYDYLDYCFFKIGNHRNGKGTICYQHSNVIHIDESEEGVSIVLLGHPALDADTSALIQPGSVNVLISHFRPNINQYIKEEIDVAKLIAPFDITFASDIHEPIELCEGRLVYTNHPLNSSFELAPCCGCVLLSCDDAQVTWERVPLHLPNLVKLAVTAEEYEAGDYITNDRDYYRIEIKGTTEDLRRLRTDAENVKLHKIPEILDTYSNDEPAPEHMTLEESLIEYMTTVLCLSEVKTQEMMALYREV